MGRLERLLSKADRFKENGRFEDALRVLNKAHQIAPQDPYVHLSFALTYDAMERFDLSIKFFKKAINLKPNDENILTHFGITLSRINRFNEAIEIFKKALSIQPNSTVAKWYLGLSYKSLGFYEDSIRILSGCATSSDEIHSLKDEMHYQLGQCYFDMGWTKEALSEFRKHLKLNPSDIWAKLSIGNCFFDFGWIDESINKFKEIINLNPDFIPGYNALAFSFAEKGWYDDALEILKQAQSIAPDDESIKDNINYIESLIDNGDDNKVLILLSILFQIYKNKTQQLKPND